MDKIIDKKRLLELAKVETSEKTDPNFVNIFRAPAVQQPKLKFNREERSVDQFVEFCKHLSHQNSNSFDPAFLNSQTKISKENVIIKFKKKIYVFI